jgi:hypothetical protein
MTEETVSASPAEGEELPEEVQQVEEQQAEDTTNSEQQEDPAKDAAAESRKVKGGFQKRIDSLTREREQERREKERLLSLVESLTNQRKPQETRQASDSEPKRENFESYEDWHKALNDYHVDRKFEAKMREFEQKRTQETQQAQQVRQQQEWTAKLNEASSKYDDWDVIAESDAPVTGAMSAAIMESDKGPDIAYYLAKHPAEAARIAALSPVSQAREIGKIETTLSRPVKTSSAPDPIRPVGARSTGGDPLSDKLPMAEWAKNFNKEFYKGR